MVAAKITVGGLTFHVLKASSNPTTVSLLLDSKDGLLDNAGLPMIKYTTEGAEIPFWLFVESATLPATIATLREAICENRSSTDTILYDDTTELTRIAIGGQYQDREGEFTVYPRDDQAALVRVVIRYKKLDANSPSGGRNPRNYGTPTDTKVYPLEASFKRDVAGRLLVECKVEFRNLSTDTCKADALAMVNAAKARSSTFTDAFPNLPPASELRLVDDYIEHSDWYSAADPYTSKAVLTMSFVEILPALDAIDSRIKNVTFNARATPRTLPTSVGQTGYVYEVSGSFNIKNFGNTTFDASDTEPAHFTKSEAVTACNIVLEHIEGILSQGTSKVLSWTYGIDEVGKVDFQGTLIAKSTIISATDKLTTVTQSRIKRRYDVKGRIWNYKPEGGDIVIYEHEYSVSQLGGTPTYKKPTGIPAGYEIDKEIESEEKTTTATMGLAKEGAINVVAKAWRKSYVDTKGERRTDVRK